MGAAVIHGGRSITLPNAASDDRDQALHRQAPPSSRSVARTRACDSEPPRRNHRPSGSSSGAFRQPRRERRRRRVEPDVTGDCRCRARKRFRSPLPSPRSSGPYPWPMSVRSASRATSRSTHHTAPPRSGTPGVRAQAVGLPLRAKRRHELHRRSRLPLPPVPVHPAGGRTGRGSGSGSRSRLGVLTSSRSRKPDCRPSPASTLPRWASDSTVRVLHRPQPPARSSRAIRSTNNIVVVANLQ